MVDLLDRISSRIYFLAGQGADCIDETSGRPTVIRPALENELRNWDPNLPTLHLNHWFCSGSSNNRGVPLIWSKGRLTTVIRSLMELAIGQPLHPSWRVKRRCHLADCIRPAHHHLVTSYTTIGVIGEPLPANAFAIPQADADQDMIDLMDMILMVDARREDPGTLLARKPLWDYSAAQVAEAQRRIATEGL